MMKAFAAGVRLGIFLLGAGVGLIGALTPSGWELLLLLHGLQNV